MGNLFFKHFEETKLTSSVVRIENGLIVGKQFDVGNGRLVDAFLGIPFAKPPMGELRYQKPQKPESWEGVRECKKHGPRAPQVTLPIEKLSMRIPTSEDCLYLNVFAPEPFADQEHRLAVMVFIPGGGFATHTSANYGDIGICRHLCTKDVVVVTTQYRLGMLGFMATGDENCISNLGLRDQAFALQWVKDNIAAFGGDPNNITIFGQSAGGASVDMLCLSPYTRGSEAFVGNGNEFVFYNFHFSQTFHSFISENELSRSLMEFLKKQPSKNLALGILPTRKKETRQSGLYFVPIIDGDFLPEPVAELRKKTPKKICIIGTTEYEGLLFAAAAKGHFGVKATKKMIPSRITPDQFPDYEELRKKAVSLYVKEGQSRSEQDHGYVKLLSDIFITNAVHDFAEDMTQAGHTVYLYCFNYFDADKMGLLKYFFPFEGSTHSAELPYLFAKGMLAPFNPTPIDLRVLENFTTIFTNFAKYGNPNGTSADKKWEPLTPSDTYKYMCIGEELIMKSDYEERRAAFWRELKNRTEAEAARKEDEKVDERM
ncbi:unnamed protein product [Toxocara canis]|uniref:Carboxylic ester hydrolase n=1 Tax=Toxocara canis TaxID=6265 RepID=A0A183UCY1_TOXCA|nr:unnamed protein product [Toxocara canis]